MTVDVLAVGAHADDVELGIGGLVHKLARTGRRVAILDLTRAELSTRGSIEERAREAEAAAQCLNVAVRANAQLPDGGLANTAEQRAVVIPFLRTFRPKLLLAPMAGDRHPDHDAAHGLVLDANYFAGLRRIETGQEAHRTPTVCYYHPYTDTLAPQIVVDVSEDFEAKLDALRAYRSQFHNAEYPGATTFISSEDFWQGIRTRAAYWGARIGAAFGEPLYLDGPLGVEFPPGLEAPPCA